MKFKVGKQQRKINKTKIFLWKKKKINEINKPLARLKEDKAQTTNKIHS